jgi:hypothetical protein
VVANARVRGGSRRALRRRRNRTAHPTAGSAPITGDDRRDSRPADRGRPWPSALSFGPTRPCRSRSSRREPASPRSERRAWGDPPGLTLHRGRAATIKPAEPNHAQLLEYSMTDENVYPPPPRARAESSRPHHPPSSSPPLNFSWVHLSAIMPPVSASPRASTSASHH